MLRLIQLQNGTIRKIGVVDEPVVRLISEFSSIYGLAIAAIQSGVKLSALIKQQNTDPEAASGLAAGVVPDRSGGLQTRR